MRDHLHTGKKTVIKYSRCFKLLGWKEGKTGGVGRERWKEEGKEGERKGKFNIYHEINTEFVTQKKDETLNQNLFQIRRLIMTRVGVKSYCSHNEIFFRKEQSRLPGKSFKWLEKAGKGNWLMLYGGQ